jgi:hypothetical protein
MATYNKYEKFVEHLAKAVHDFSAHSFRVALTNTAPNLGTHAVRADISELSTGNGYTQDSHSTSIGGTTESGGTLSITATDVVVTASGAVGPFRYAVLYNTTPSSPADPLIAEWDYGSAVTLANTETFTTDFGATLFTLT